MRTACLRIRNDNAIPILCHCVPRRRCITWKLGLGRKSTMPQPEQLVRRFYNDIWNKRDESLARTLLAPDFRFRGSLGDEKRGPTGFIDYMRAVHRSLSEYTCTIDDLICMETRAAARMSFSGIHQGDFLGTPPTGRSISWSGAAFFTFAQDQIVELWVLGDIDAIRTQLAP